MTEIFITQPKINIRKNIGHIINNNHINNYLYQYIKLNSNENYFNILKELFDNFLNITEIKYNNNNTKLNIIFEKIKLINYHFNNQTNDFLFKILHSRKYIQNYYYNLVEDFVINKNLNDNLSILFDNSFSKEKNFKICEKHSKNFEYYICKNLKEIINKKLTLHEITNLINILNVKKVTYINKILYNILNIYSRELILKMNVKNVLKLDNYSILKYDINSKINIKNYVNSFEVLKYDILSKSENQNLVKIILNYFDKISVEKYKLLDDFNIYSEEFQENIIRFYKFDNDDLLSETSLYKEIRVEIDNYLAKLINSSGSINTYISNVFMNYNNNDKYYNLIFFTKFIENTDLFEIIYSVKYKEYLLGTNIEFEFEFEEIKLNRLSKYYGNNETKFEYINKLKRILIDINVNKDLNVEYKNQLVLKNNTINKCKNYIDPDIFIVNTYSSNIWNLENNLMINVNSGILKEYVGYYDKIYNTKFDNRKLNWYGNYGNIKFMLDDEVEINCSLIIFQILEFINEKEVSYSEIKKNINIFDNYLKPILDNLIDNNIILFENEKYKFNEISKMEKIYNLSEKIILKDNIKEEVKISYEYLVRSNIVYCLKKEKTILKHILFNKVKSNISKFYELNTEIFEKTIKKLDKEYLIIKENLIEYYL